MKSQLILGVILIGSGCSVFLPQSVPLYERPETVVLHWRKTEEVATACSELLGLAYADAGGCSRWWQDQNGTWHGEIYARQPRGWKDQKRMKILGHEVWHIFRHDSHHTEKE